MLSTTLHSDYTQLRVLSNSQINTQKVLFNQRSPALTEITLNKPEKLNSIDIEMAITLIEKLTEWRLNKTTP